MKKGEVPCDEYGVFSEVRSTPQEFVSSPSPSPCLIMLTTPIKILTSQIRSEIASSSERAYPSLPLSSTKSLLFLDSEGAVVDFARQRGWVVRDSHIYFPAAVATSAPTAHIVDGESTHTGLHQDSGEKEMSEMVIENTLGYARELETIV
jgi:26S proteasome regulatory subunit N12